jgi:hypothetical protein
MYSTEDAARNPILAGINLHTATLKACADSNLSAADTLKNISASKGAVIEQTYGVFLGNEHYLHGEESIRLNQMRAAGKMQMATTMFTSAKLASAMFKGWFGKEETVNSNNNNKAGATLASA